MNFRECAFNLVAKQPENPFLHVDKVIQLYEGTRDSSLIVEYATAVLSKGIQKDVINAYNERRNDELQFIVDMMARINEIPQNEVLKIFNYWQIATTKFEKCETNCNRFIKFIKNDYWM
jgi:hypothetical protein